MYFEETSLSRTWPYRMVRSGGGGDVLDRIGPSGKRCQETMLQILFPSAQQLVRVIDMEKTEKRKRNLQKGETSGWICHCFHWSTTEKTFDELSNLAIAICASFFAVGVELTLSFPEQHARLSLKVQHLLNIHFSCADFCSSIEKIVQSKKLKHFCLALLREAEARLCAVSVGVFTKSKFPTCYKAVDNFLLSEIKTNLLS